LIALRHGGAVTVEESSPDGFKMAADLSVGAGEAATIKLYFAKVDLQEPADE
jgi:hypothetical protein